MRMQRRLGTGTGLGQGGHGTPCPLGHPRPSFGRGISNLAARNPGHTGHCSIILRERPAPRATPLERSSGCPTATPQSQHSPQSLCSPRGLRSEISGVWMGRTQGLWGALGEAGGLGSLRAVQGSYEGILGIRSRAGGFRLSWGEFRGAREFQGTSLGAPAIPGEGSRGLPIGTDHRVHLPLLSWVGTGNPGQFKGTGVWRDGSSGCGGSQGVRTHLKSGRLSCSFFRARFRVM